VRSWYSGLLDAGNGGIEKLTKKPVNFSERLVGEMGAAFYIRYSVNIDADLVSTIRHVWFL
jgi:hypothetical protein